MFLKNYFLEIFSFSRFFLESISIKIFLFRKVFRKKSESCKVGKTKDYFSFFLGCFTFFWSRGTIKMLNTHSYCAIFKNPKKSHSKILGNASWRRLQVKNIFVTLEKMGKSHLGEKSLFKSITG